MADLPSVKVVKVYLKTSREQQLFNKIKTALGEDDTGTFVHVLKNYAERMNLISEELHSKNF